MSIKWVEIGRVIDYGDLEKALKKAAEKVGWDVEVKDNFNEGYRLGSVQETKEYKDTAICLSGRFFPAMRVVAYKNNKHKGQFMVCTGFYGGVASEKRVREYLSVVSEVLAAAA